MLVECPHKQSTEKYLVVEAILEYVPDEHCRVGEPMDEHCSQPPLNEMNRDEI